MKSKRLSTVFLIAAVCLGALFFLKKRPPNVIIIMVDTLRKDYLGVYGFPGPISPHIDSFASHSFVFENVHSPAPWTPMSVASTFLGRHGIIDKAHKKKFTAYYLNEDTKTMAESFLEAGYDTKGIVYNAYLNKEYGFSRGFTSYVQEHKSINYKLRRWLANRNNDRPVFLYLHFLDVHGPYNVKKKTYEKFKDNPHFGPDRKITPKEKELFLAALDIKEPWISEELKETKNFWRTAYASGVYEFDQLFKTTLDILRQFDMYEESVIILTSDHGEHLLEHGGWSHGYNLYNHQLAVPLIIKTPHQRAGMIRSPLLINLIDLYPTLVNLSGIKTSNNALEGVDFSSVFSSLNFQTSRRANFATHVKSKPGEYSIQSVDKKIIWKKREGRKFFFDLKYDGNEKNYIGNPDGAAFDFLMEEMVKIVNKIENQPSIVGPKELNTQDIEKLKSLGYF